jgi:hypothetical protein
MGTSRGEARVSGSQASPRMIVARPETEDDPNDLM